MGRFVKGDIVVLSYPFSDFSGTKRRPALVIADMDGDDVILCQITSQAKTDRYALNLEDADFTDGKLNIKSVVRPNKIFTANSNIILYTACKIRSQKADIIINAVLDIINIKSDIANGKYVYQIRLTGILVHENRILIVKQKVDDRNWSLPGGRLEHDEIIEAALIREIKEETGLDVSVQKLLYLCDKPNSEPPIIHATFLLKLVGGNIIVPTNKFDANPISDVQFVCIDNLPDFGFSDVFTDLVKNNFPDSGSYKHEKKNIGL